MRTILLACLATALVGTQLRPAAAAPKPKLPSFAAFDKAARKGEKLNVVFFGASLTWGANATNPPLTSYRADVSNKFEAMYPKAHFKFWDAAIGGTGSTLGVYRLNRDVLSRNPDLVFLDFSANDDINTNDPESLATYESLVRRLVEKGIPVVQVIFPFEWNIAPGEMAKMKRRDAHLAISKAYNTPVGDAIAYITQQVNSKQVGIKEIWPVDGVHPGDKGYTYFAAPAWAAYQNAIATKQVEKLPATMLYSPTYMTTNRARISQLGPLPAGWTVGHPNLTSAFFDFLMSRWLDDEVVATNMKSVTGADGKTTMVPQPVERLKFKFQAASVSLFGETTLKTNKYRAYIDGKNVEHSEWGVVKTEFDPGSFGRAINGNGHHAQVLATGLDPNVVHTLEIEPLFTDGTEQELRLESVCVAGGPAKVMRDE